MKKTFYTPTGEETRELTSQELSFFAASGDIQARKEILSQDKAKALTIEERVAAIEKYLGV